MHKLGLTDNMLYVKAMRLYIVSSFPASHYSDRLLGRIFLQGEIDASIVVLGQCVDELGIIESGPVFIAGGVVRQEYARVIQQYRIGKLFLPYRTRRFGLVDQVGAACGLQKAYFDWSFGALDKDTGDLPLDPRICLERAALGVGAWLLNEPIDCFLR